MEVSIGPDTLLRGTRSWADTQVRPYAGEGEVPATTRASGAERSVCAADGRNGVRIRAEIIPKVPINLGQSLSQPCG